MRVSDVMNTKVQTIPPTLTMQEAAVIFDRYHIDGAPVVDADNHLLGAVTVDDVLDHLLPHDWRDDYEDPQFEQLADTQGAT